MNQILAVLAIHLALASFVYAKRSKLDDFKCPPVSSGLSLTNTEGGTNTDATSGRRGGFVNCTYGDINRDGRSTVFQKELKSCKKNYSAEVTATDDGTITLWCDSPEI